MATTKKVRTFINSCLQRILRIYVGQSPSTKKTYGETNQRPADAEIMMRGWRRIGHTLQSLLALSWNPQGKRKRGRHRNSWRRHSEEDIKKLGLAWSQLERKARDRDSWRTPVGDLCSRRGTRHK